MMKCVILDDEPLAHQVLEHYIMETPGFTLAAKFRNAVEAYEYLGKNKVDLLFLDIEMPLISGVNFLQALPNAPQTIFTTAYKKYAFEGFELNAVDYLLKPFSYERFIKAIQKIQKTEVSDLITNTLIIKDKNGLLNLKQQDILYIEGCKDYVKIITVDKEFIIYHTLKGILERLNLSIFAQAHKSYLVNKMHVSRIAQDQLVIGVQTIIPIGKSFKKELMQHLDM